MKRGLLVVGHGSRAEEAQRVFAQVVTYMKTASPDSVIESAHMELCGPTIDQSVKKLADQGVNEIVVIPYFLYKGIHLQKDIPEIIQRIAEEYSHVRFAIAEPIGAEPVLAEILLTRAGEVANRAVVL